MKHLSLTPARPIQRSDISDEFSCQLQQQAADDDDLFSRLIFSDEATFRTSGKINKHNCRVWDTQKPHRIIEHERDSPKQDGARSHFHNAVRAYLNMEMSDRWIGRAGVRDRCFMTWSRRSPDMTACDFFLWGIKDSVFVPPLPRDLEELKTGPLLQCQATKGKTLKERDSIRCCGLNFGVAQWLESLRYMVSRETLRRYAIRRSETNTNGTEFDPTSSRVLESPSCQDHHEYHTRIDEIGKLVILYHNTRYCTVHDIVQSVERTDELTRKQPLKESSPCNWS
ncbi:hypothetical protein ANN_11046 [Periplaneta americana]|uniref:Uncharacterized protein n=1 Tax=Periplaneta americana TaxID=6978 RepID=A0ABQ8T684_PERAM|nr:hypothetical protein ANN_11046 [Periplaneta americana]